MASTPESMRRSTASAPISSMSFCALSGFWPTRRLKHATTAACFSRSGRGSSSRLFVFLVKEVCQEYWGAAILLCTAGGVWVRLVARRGGGVPFRQQLAVAVYVQNVSQLVCARLAGPRFAKLLDMLVPLYASSPSQGALAVFIRAFVPRVRTPLCANPEGAGLLGVI